jgi:hypothetical protein
VAKHAHPEYFDDTMEGRKEGRKERSRRDLGTDIIVKR